MKDTIDREILTLLRTEKQADIGELAKQLYVSPSTVRRKLAAMQEKGLVTRIHGGVKINDEYDFFPSFTFRSHQNCLEKKKIALSAIKLIRNGDLIFLDGSTSAFFIAEYLAGYKNIKVVTNGIDTLSLLSRNKIPAYSTGGFISPVNNSVLIGEHAERTIRQFRADVAFVSAQSVQADGEVYDCFEDENVLRNAMCAHAARRVILCDSTQHQVRAHRAIQTMFVKRVRLYGMRQGRRRLLHHPRPARDTFRLKIVPLSTSKKRSGRSFA